MHNINGNIVNGAKKLISTKNIEPMDIIYNNKNELPSLH